MKTGRPTDRIAEATPESRRFPANMSFNGKDDYRLSAESLSTPEAGASRHGRLQLLELIDQLGERDFEILLSLKSAKYLLTGQVKRLHFTDASSDTAAMRAAVRAMRKLERYGLVKTFKRRIGGLRAGSGSLVWCLTESGQRLLNIRDHTEQSRRSHRYLEPSYVHLRHTLAIAECYVQLVELSRIHKKIVLASVEWEPESWRPYTHNGHNLQLKPDLFAVTYNGGYEDRWFIEIDLNTEALPVVIDKCKRYHQYLRTGIEQREHEVFPVTIWVVPSIDRKQKLIDALDEAFRKAPNLFVVITADEFDSLIRNGADQKKMH